MTDIGLPDYSLDDALYTGTRTVLYRGRRDADRTPVVVKVPKGEPQTARDIATLWHEHDILRDLPLAGVVKPYGIERINGGFALVLEQPPGRPLSNVLRAGRLPVAMSLRIASSLAEVLALVHERQIIHKDITPSNVLVDEASGQTWLIDFGIATRLTQETQQATSPEALEGTLAYMSPEQTGRMNRAIDRRTDFYSLGVTLYQMLTGVLPFASTDPLELVHCHVARMPPSPRERAPEVPEAVARVAMKLLAKAAEERYQSGRGLKADLDECLRQLESTGTVVEFPLGRGDGGDVLRIPERLYGRDAEVGQLLSAFERVADGGAELLLVSGYSGIGKSALVHEIHKGIAQRGGHFVSGKFDQLNRSTPYASIAQAFRALLRQLLAGSPGELAQRREALLSAFGHSGQVLVDLIPELALVIGPQPPAPALGPTESQNRWNLLFKNFASVFAAEGRPLVLFLDDLQWADAASLKLLQALLADPDCRHVLVIGAYRNNEVDLTHPLRLALDELGKLGATVSEISLAPLSLADGEALLADTLGCDRQRAAPLAALLLSRTQNNPFFLKHFLSALHEEHLLRYEPTRGAWTWDAEAIERRPVTANVVELMAAKIQQLDPAARRVLELAASIGHTFDLRTLSTIDERPLVETARALWTALREGLVVPLDASYRLVHAHGGEGAGAAADLEVRYRFLHDRVQQAAYSLIDDGQRRALHLRVGRLMLAGASDEALDKALFDVVSHLNLGAALIEAGDERTRLAELNCAAGKKAKAATAYRAAADFFRQGLSVLPEGAWDDAYELTLALHRERAEADYLSGDFGAADALYPIALSRARTPMDKVEIYFVQATQYQLQGRNGEAIAIHLAAARLLGWEVPEAEEARKAPLEAELEAVHAHLGGREIEALVHAPKMTRPETKALMRLLQGLFYAAYVHSQQTLANLTLVKMTTLSLEHGSSELSPFGYVGYGIVAGGLLGDHRTGHRFGKMAIALCEQFDNIGIQCKANFLFAADVHSWSSPIRAADEYYDRAYELGVESGDWVTVGYTIIQSGSDRLTRGKDLAELDDLCRTHLAFLQRAKNHDVIDLLRAGVIQPLRNLKGLTRSRSSFDATSFSEAEYIARYAEQPYHLAWLYYAKIRSAFLFRERASFPNLVDKLEIVERFVPSHAKVPEATFYVALIRLALCAAAGEAERAAHLAEVSRLEARLARWAESCRENIEHKALLVAAERARVEGRTTDAMDLYERAIEAARQSDYVNNQALANELYGRFWAEHGRSEIARLFLRKAVVLFDRWGATAKVKALVEELPDLGGVIGEARDGRPLGGAVGSTTSAWPGMGELLDLAAVLRAGQTLSNETAFDQVVNQLMRIVLGNAGARRGFLILQRDGELLVEAKITVDPDAVEVGIRAPLHEREDLAAAVVQYVARTSEPVVLDDAAGDPRFSADPYVVARRPRAILCLPLLHRGGVTGVFYLENELARNVFTATRIELLQLISSHAAIAVQNAMFYTSMQEASALLREANDRLEQQVADRTEALREANEHLQTRSEELHALNERLRHELSEGERAEAARTALQEEVIRMQRAQLAEMSTPLIPITDRVMAMPLVGTMDARRAAQVLETVLAGAQQRGAQVVILDVTGMRQVDHEVASSLIKTANGLRLLGAQAVLTGIRPDMAQTLVGMDVDLSGIVVRGTLQSGIAYAVGRGDAARGARRGNA